MMPVSTASSSDSIAIASLPGSTTGTVKSTGAGRPRSDLFKLVNETARHGLDGLSQLRAYRARSAASAIRMNAGGNFGDIGQVIESVSMLDMTGRRIEIDRDELTFDYRQSSIPNGIVCSAVLQLEPTDPVKVRNKVREIFAKKKASQLHGRQLSRCAEIPSWMGRESPPANSSTRLD